VLNFNVLGYLLYGDVGVLYKCICILGANYFEYRYILVVHAFNESFLSCCPI
jgi:hypothetical protein